MFGRTISFHQLFSFFNIYSVYIYTLHTHTHLLAHILNICFVVVNKTQKGCEKLTAPIEKKRAIIIELMFTNQNNSITNRKSLECVRRFFFLSKKIHRCRFFWMNFVQNNKPQTNLRSDAFQLFNINFPNVPSNFECVDFFSFFSDAGLKKSRTIHTLSSQLSIVLKKDTPPNTVQSNE